MRRKPRFRFESPRSLIRCPDCGTIWRTAYCPLCDPAVKLPDRLVEARLKAGLTPAAAALAAGIAPAALAAAELGRLALQAEELADLARAYRVPGKCFGVNGE